MGATEEQMALLATAQVSHVSYILILYSVAFVLFLCKYRDALPLGCQRLTFFLSSREHASSPLRSRFEAC